MNSDDIDWPVYRTRPLPTAELVGEFIVADSVITATRDALVAAAHAGRKHGGHEGIAFWAGRETHGLAILTTAVIPSAHHAPGRVHVEEAAYGRAAVAARARGVVLLAQVHSHPGSDTRHSDGDDDLIIMPFEGMLSVVVPHYGAGWNGIETASVHQFRGGRWVLCDPESIQRGITVVPTVLDTR